MPYPPREVTAKLGISPATLRRWAVEFRELLSGDAAQSLLPGGAPLHRSYSDQDIRLLARVKELRGQGVGYDAIRGRLSGEVSEAAQSPEGEQERSTGLMLSEEARLMLATQQQALIERERVIEGLQQAVEAKDAHITDLQAERDRANDRADRAEAEARELRRALLDQVQKPAPARRWWEFWRRVD